VNPETAVTVIFNRPVVPLVMSEQMAEFPSPLQFTPEIEGTGEWVNTSVYVFRPDAKFIGRETYSVHVSAEVVNELSATGSTLANDYRWNFSVSAPTIYGLELPNITQWPSNNYEHLRLDQDFLVRFNQPMNTAATESATTLASEEGQQPLRFSWNDTNTTLFITPTQLLELGTRYVLSVADTATAEAGGRVRDSLVWSAVTALPPSITFISRPDWVSPWKDSGRESTCSKKRDIMARRLRCAMRSASSATATLAPMAESPTAPQSSSSAPASTIGARAGRQGKRPECIPSIRSPAICTEGVRGSAAVGLSPPDCG
jgi:hypothetical protein